MMIGAPRYGTCRLLLVVAGLGAAHGDSALAHRHLQDSDACAADVVQVRHAPPYVCL